MTPKIGDFGLSFTALSSRDIIPEEIFANEAMNDTYCVGSPMYASPEQLSEGRATVASDVFSLGVMMFECYNKFSTLMERDMTLQRFRQGQVDDAIGKTFPEEIALCLRMASRFPVQRPTLKVVVDTIKKILKDLREAPTLSSKVKVPPVTTASLKRKDICVEPLLASSKEELRASSSPVCDGTPSEQSTPNRPSQCAIETRLRDAT